MMVKQLHDGAEIFRSTEGLRIGLFGGSFNPAHKGHGHVADVALQKLNLDKVFWLVSKQNPLKSNSDMGDFESRYNSAKKVAEKCRFASHMRVTDIEKSFRTKWTAGIITSICKLMPQSKLFWIMGADSLADFHKWHKPDLIASTLPIAVIARPTYEKTALNSPGARIAGEKLSPSRFAKEAKPNTWCFIRGPMREESSTAIRQKRGGQ